MPLHLPLLGLALVLLAATAMGPLLRPAPTPMTALAVTGDTPIDAGARQASPFGSGAALRNLLF